MPVIVFWKTPYNLFSYVKISTNLFFKKIPAPVDGFDF